MFDALIATFERLQAAETANGQWGLGGTRLPFGDRLQERFPVVGRFLDEQGEVAASRLTPDQLAKTLEGVFS